VSIFARQICCWVSGLLSRYPEARQQLCRVISAAAQAAEDANQLHDEEFISLKQRSHGVCVCGNVQELEKDRLGRRDGQKAAQSIFAPNFIAHFTVSVPNKNWQTLKKTPRSKWKALNCLSVRGDLYDTELEENKCGLFAMCLQASLIAVARPRPH